MCFLKKVCYSLPMFLSFAKKMSYVLVTRAALELCTKHPYLAGIVLGPALYGTFHI